MINRPLLFQRWTGVTWSSLTRLNESMKKLTSKVGKLNLKRYCLSVVVNIKSTLTPDVEALPLSQDTLLDMMGTTTLSHHGGHFVEGMPVREVTISNDIEGYLPEGKRDLIVPAAGLPSDEGPQVLNHTFILAYADRWHAQGEVDTLRRIQGAKPMSMMAGDSEFVLQFRDLPPLWAADGTSVSVGLWVHETASELVDRPSRIVRSSDPKDPIPYPYAFKKPAFAALVSDPNQLIAFAGSIAAHPRLEVDGYNQLEQLSIYEQEIFRRTIRPDGDKLGINGSLAGDLIGQRSFVLTDPFEAQRVTEFNSGHDFNIWGDLQALQQAAGAGKLTLLTRLYEDLAATEYAVQMSRDNVSTKARKDIRIGGSPAQSHHLTRGEGLGIQPEVRTRAENRQPSPADVE